MVEVELSTLYFHKEIYNHEYLGSLEQMYKTICYFDDDHDQAASDEETNYKHFG